jgi:hypothetical protein
VAAVLALAVAAGGCSRGGRAVEDGEPATQEHKVGVAQDQRALTEAADKDKQDEGPGNPRNTRDPVSGMMQAGPLQALNNSGVSGTFSAEPAGTGTAFNVSVNAPAGGSGGYRVSLNRGPCSSLGAPVAEVTQLQVGTATVASRSDTVPLAPTAIMNGEHALVVYGGQRAEPLACASLPRNAPIPGTTSPPGT